ncbi:MAG: hypothetical protein FWF88_04930 [Peptococcaceae bacterium]|jgi:hypothetical protein|nr:hypothetical protein [Peptococcaceae bacterium]
MTNIETAKQFIGKRRYENYPQYQNAMTHMRFDEFSEEDMMFFKDLYEHTKDIFSRKQVLDAFVLRCLHYDLKDFFLYAFKKERYLDMRLTAIRGYSAYTTEKEVIPLMKKFTEILMKIPINTPYYKEYWLLRSRFGLPYLVEKYGYGCFVEAQLQLEKQYNEMPDEYPDGFGEYSSSVTVSHKKTKQDMYTLDENGLIIKTPEYEQRILEMKKKRWTP